MADRHGARSHGVVRQRKGLIQTYADSDRCRQVHSIELHGDELEQNRQIAADSDIHQIQTDSNRFSRKIQTEVDEEQTTDNSRRSRFRQQQTDAGRQSSRFRQRIQTTDSHANKPGQNQTKPGQIRQSKSNT
ncbi:hypothetical protein Tco_0704515 [Tanacetum coccineum]|uniref:Uncharacterized protein n=1 Tax=Tanacetum coccineum TaxID=301880 RepID=A0ABQ4Y2A7_9ASTR